MGEPRLHHYVPQFYLRRFADPRGRLWAWDKAGGSSFQVGAGNLAAERDFYRLRWLEEHGHDPMTMEKQFADLESDVAAITGQWVDWLRQAEPEDTIPIPAPNREIVALFLALQHLRTADHRDILGAFATEAREGSAPTPAELADLHTDVLWREDVFRPLQARLQGYAWVFARNATATPFVTSDNPLAFKTGDNRQWRKAGVTAIGIHAVYPLAPDLILYCYPLEGRWANVQKFDCALSPVTLTRDMVEHENSGQVFGASRFVLSRENDFAFARAFAPIIGTDTHASQPEAGD
jgi:Protein of unknown function (DUF4238)